MTFENILLVVAGVLTSLLSGLFYGYAVSVNLGLGRLKDHEYIAAMQSINRAILNPLFFLSFLGPVLLLPWVTFLYREVSDSLQFTLLLVASVLYIFGVFILTAAGNVPLNDRLAEFDMSKASAKEIVEARTRYEKPWNRLHVIRTLAAIFATVLVFLACLTR